MPTAVDFDLSSFLESLSFGADDLHAARAAVRTSRDQRRAAEQAARKTDDTGPKGALRRATAYWLLSRPDDALRVLPEAGDSPQAVLLRGRCALEAGDPSAAAASFATLVGSNADGRSLLVDLATAAGLAGDTGTAQRAAAKLGDGADSLYAEGIALESDGEYEEARRKYEEAIDADPHHARALFRLAHRLDTAGQDAKAIEIYRRLVALQPTYVNALLNLALLYEDAGRYADAESCYRKVLQADPNHIRARLGLKDVLASQTMYFDEDHERREDRRNQVMRTPISEFELSVRSRNCLAKMNIETLGDLVRKSEAELLAYKNFGETSLQEIKDILAQKGLRLGMLHDDDAPLYTTSRAEAEAQLDELFGAGDTDEDEPAVLTAEGRDPRDIPIEELDLSIRARRCMDNLEIRTVGELLDRSEHELMTSKNFGQTSLNEVRKRLDQMGLALRKK
jgi:DNA-directed RNA polymerase subunit alpha